ncbi:MAG: tRNA (adenosine(37)-N6)-threonylcarbamoyltransferase complex dimerization subunit type 1 TsaB [Clostridia bacterium]|nr:tRNA (adenosine(37)-N6)-threonylcarbamoyltransferase complex dimerization subunit type 1 TsaB [Clostridia bacterium]
MMTLAVDTSALTASVAITDGEKILCELSFTTALTHSETLMPMIDFALSGTKLTCADIDVFAFAGGPGSFTGLRIGAATIKGLARGAGKPIVGVSTLEALAYNVMRDGFTIAPIMDARRGEVYCALYRFNNGSIECLRQPDATALEMFVRDIDGEAIFVGDAVDVYKNRISSLLDKRAIFAPQNSLLQRASSVAMAATGKKPLEDAQLVYLRKSQAEREYAFKETNLK